MAYRFGPFLLNPESRLLQRDGETVSLTAKVLETLVVLVQNRGRVMDKDELLRVLWPDTVVEEANLTQNISTLRKALGDNPKDHYFIATIQGRGYQFVASVTEVISGQANPNWPQARNATAHRSLRLRWFSLTLAGGVMIPAVVWFWPSWRGYRELKQPMEAIPFTSLRGSVRHPAFSPDGNAIAYSWMSEDGVSQSIYVKLIGLESQLRVTMPPGSDFAPVWSPDGKQIAFYRNLQGASGYYVVAALGGPVRRIMRTDLVVGRLDWFPDDRLAWSRDGKHLVVEVGRTPSGPTPGRDEAWHQLALIDVDSREQRLLTSPPSGAMGDSNPAISADGRMLAFRRTSATALSEIYLLNLSSGQTRQLTNFRDAHIGRIAWTPDSREIVFAMLRNGAAHFWRMKIESGVVRPITTGTERVFSPAISPRGDRLAYVVSTDHSNLWRFDISNSKPPTAGLPTRFTSSTRDDSAPMYSPDGRKVAFSSDRAGSDEIWVVDANGGGAQRLTTASGPDNGSPRWSHDGSEIAFDSRRDGNPEIYVVSSEGGKLRRVTNHPAEDVLPSWSRDGRWIYFASNRTGDFQIWKVSADQGETLSSPSAQVTKGGGFNAIESMDSKYLYFAKGRDRQSLWRRTLKSEDNLEELVLEPLRRWGWWALGPEGIFFLSQSGDAPNTKVGLNFMDLESRRIAELSTLDNPVNPWKIAITASPDGRHVVCEQMEQASSIVLVENFR